MRVLPENSRLAASDQTGPRDSAVSFVDDIDSKNLPTLARETVPAAPAVARPQMGATTVTGTRSRQATLVGSANMP